MPIRRRLPVGTRPGQELLLEDADLDLQKVDLLRELDRKISRAKGGTSGSLAIRCSRSLMGPVAPKRRCGGRRGSGEIKYKKARERHAARRSGHCHPRFVHPEDGISVLSTAAAHWR